MKYTILQIANLIKIIHKKKKTNRESLNFQYLKLFCLNNLMSQITPINSVSQ